MLSILIPIYNFCVREFVIELHRQAMQCKVIFEIRCYDDGSESRYCSMNRELEQLEHVIYKEIPENIGRSAIRNLLATEAAFPYLLFADCDSYPEYSDFIKRYINKLEPGTIIYGGRSYESKPPDDIKKYFRWFYGINREVFSTEHRSIHPYHSFQTNNFAIPADIFLSIRLNEQLIGYGHEDTLLGVELRNRNIPIIHIDNPLRHLCLEDHDEFLEKSRQGIKNLAFLLHQGTDVGIIRLARAYRHLRKRGLQSLFLWWFRGNKNRLLKKICSPRPSLRAFDLYKLGELTTAMRSYKN